MIDFVNKYLLGVAVPICLVAFGIYFGFYLRWFHLLHPIRTARLALHGGKKAFSSLSLALAGTLGVGNLVGVAAAIAGGGCGAVLWMWLSALFAMILKYAEIVLAMRHKRRAGKENSQGSAMLYIYDCFLSRGHKGLAVLASAVFACLLTLNALTMGSLIQTEAACDALFLSLSIPKPLTAAIIATVTLWVSLRGRERLMWLTEKIVPLMTAVVLALSAGVLIVRAEAIPNAFLRIFSEALEPQAAAGGIFGFLLSDALRLGTMRGLISNEAGCGTSPTAHAEADTKAPAVQGVFGIFEVFADTILLCTVTALVIIVSGVPLDGASFMEITVSAYSSVLGEWSAYFMSASVLCFGLATVLCWSHYGSAGVGYLKDSPWTKSVFCIVYAMSVFLGGIISSELSWQIADLCIGAMTVINLAVLFLMRREIKEETEHFYKKPKYWKIGQNLEKSHGKEDKQAINPE